MIMSNTAIINNSHHTALGLVIVALEEEQVEGRVYAL
jgi:hypothetical protein